MSTVTNLALGSYSTVVPAYLNDYGVFEDKYGVIQDPETDSYLLAENGSFLVQEDNGKIVL